LPREFPPYTTVQHYFYAWRDGGVLERINFELLPPEAHTRPILQCFARLKGLADPAMLLPRTGAP
jgi:hypothetical protein